MLASAPPALPLIIPPATTSASCATSADAHASSGAAAAGSAQSAFTSAAACRAAGGGFGWQPAGENAGADFSWSAAAVAAADPFAAADAPSRTFRLSATPAEAMGLQQNQDGTLQLAKEDAGSRKPAAAAASVERLSRQLAAAGSAPRWPPCSNGGDGGAPQPDASAGAAADGGGSSVGTASTDSADTLFASAAAKPGTGTSWNKALSADGSAPVPQQRAAPSAWQQEAEEADPAAPGTPQRGAERRPKTPCLEAAPRGFGSPLPDAAQGGFGSPLPLAPHSAAQPSPRRSSGDGRAAVAGTAAASAGKTGPQLVFLDEARLVREALLALQVTFPLLYVIMHPSISAASKNVTVDEARLVQEGAAGAW